MKDQRRYMNSGSRRRAAAIMMTAVSTSVLLGFAALAIDVGMLYNVRTELQRTADAAALAGGQKLLDHSRLTGTTNSAAVMASVKSQAEQYSLLNPVQNINPRIAANDVKIGYLNNPDNLSEPIDFSNSNRFNTVQVTVRRDEAMNGPVQLMFARIFGLTSANVSATAAASFRDGAVGFKVTARTGNADLLPLALHVDAWNALLARAGTVRDNYSFNEDTGAVSVGADGVAELNLYPGSGVDQLPPGNFGTVNIGTSNNSTKHLSNQIRYGVTQEDLDFHGGSLQLGSDGTLPLTGDPGLSAGIKDDLTAILGNPRAIPLFNQVVGNGNNTVFTIVGFAGIRILNVRLTGSMNSKQVVIQPAFVVDDAVINTGGSGSNYFVYRPLSLSR